MSKYLNVKILICFIIMNTLFTPPLVLAETQDIDVSATVLAQPTSGELIKKNDKKPIITKIEIRDITTNSAVIYWETDEFSTSAVDYGLVNYELGTVADQTNSLFTVHEIILYNLKPNTIYYFRIRSINNSGNQVFSENLYFSTLALPDKIPPTNVNKFQAKASDKEIFLSWLNPDDADFAYTRIERSIKNFPINPGDGELVYKDKEMLFWDKNLINNTQYYYTAWAYDKAGNFSSGALASATPLSAVILRKEISTSTIIQKELPTSQPDDLFLKSKIIPEKLIHKKIENNNILFFVHDDLVQLNLIDNTIYVFPNTTLTIAIPLDKFTNRIKTIQITLDNQTYLLQLNKDKKMYEGKIKISGVLNKHFLTTLIFYENGSTDIITNTVVVEQYGQIYNKNNDLIKQAVLTLYWYDKQQDKWQVWDGGKYNQKNPQVTDDEGKYQFTVLQGEYYLIISKEGYLTTKTKEFNVSNNLINFNIPLMALSAQFWAWLKVIISMLFLFLALIVLLRAWATMLL